MPDPSDNLLLDAIHQIVSNVVSTWSALPYMIQVMTIVFVAAVIGTLTLVAMRVITASPVAASSHPQDNHGKPEQ